MSDPTIVDAIRNCEYGVTTCLDTKGYRCPAFTACSSSGAFKLARELVEEADRLRTALSDLVERCDGEAGVRSDGSNIDTVAAHAALGHFDEAE